MTSTERQRLFRQRHPGYDARRKARVREIRKNNAAHALAELRAAQELKPFAELPLFAGLSAPSGSL